MMHPFFWLLVLLALIVGWIMWTRNSYQQWVEKLDLKGTWEYKQEDTNQVEVVLQFSGEKAHGDYELTTQNEITKGTWKIEGSKLVLSTTSDEPKTFELRFLDQGSIGLHGDQWDHYTFSKRSENIVPLRRKG